MEITVDEEMQRFYLAFDEWKAAVGHGIKVGEYRFCAIPLSKTINISEVTSGLKILDIPLSLDVIIATATKEDSMLFFKELGKQLEQTISRKKNFDEQLLEMKKMTFERLGDMPLIEKVAID